jgi:RNase P/RNase MRP subunit POP5
MLTDVAMWGDINVIKTEVENTGVLKCEDITIEIRCVCLCVWNVKTEALPVIIRATGTISKSLRKYLSKIPRKDRSKEIQRRHL